MKTFLFAMLAVLALSVAASEEPSIQRGAPTAVEPQSFVPRETIGVLIVTDCKAVIAVEYLLSTKDGPGVLTRSRGITGETNFARAVEEALFIQKAGGPVQAVELSPGCLRS